MPKVKIRGAGKNSPKRAYVWGVLGLKKGFTLPEVIVSFSILAMVITSAVGLLTLVIRTNSDNVNSLVANGLAQEGIEAMRFIRDSNSILGLDFDGMKKDSTFAPVWGEKLFVDVAGSSDPTYFTLLSNSYLQTDCRTDNLRACLPVALQVINTSDEDLDSLIDNDDARVYLQKTPEEPQLSGETPTPADFQYLQMEEGSLLTTDSEKLRPTQFSRVIRVEPLKSLPGVDGFDVLRVSSIVLWRDNNNQPKRLVLTSDLTNWR